VRRGPDDLLYVMDFNNMRLRRIEADGTVSTIAGDGFHAGAMEGASATDSSLENPIDFGFLPDGRVVFVSYHDPRVLVIDRDGTLIRLAGTGQPGVSGNEGDGGPATSAQFIELAGIAVAPDGTIYVSDDLAHRVRVIRGGMVDTLAGNGLPGRLGDGGPARDAALAAPTALALDAAGNLYLSDAVAHVIRKVSVDGVISTVAGTGERGSGGDGGAAIDAQLAGPDGVALDDDGVLYIGDRLNSRVRKVAPDGTISTIGGTGVRGRTGDGGPARAAEFGYVSRVQLDTDGDLLISDQTNGCIRKILSPL
jgi:sugar lactone lactonase YvrE